MKASQSTGISIAADLLSEDLIALTMPCKEETRSQILD